MPDQNGHVLTGWLKRASHVRPHETKNLLDNKVLESYSAIRIVALVAVYRTEK